MVKKYSTCTCIYNMPFHQYTRSQYVCHWNSYSYSAHISSTCRPGNVQQVSLYTLQGTYMYDRTGSRSLAALENCIGWVDGSSHGLRSVVRASIHELLFQALDSVTYLPYWRRFSDEVPYLCAQRTGSAQQAAACVAEAVGVSSYLLKAATLT